MLYLRRDLVSAVILQRELDGADGYVEGVVTNTRYGSFPHSTLTHAAWGAQVRASEVDTGSRGRRGPQNTGKRKREPAANDHPKTVTSASTGFAHLLPPTVESWCSSLPHRTQVVYTPDYSYILQRLRARPGSVLIEAGAGSGSFTHAAARAVYGRNGRVWSFEFHEQRTQKLNAELRDHGLSGFVSVTQRDVYEDGFRISHEVRANAIFLDLPAPWLALKHLTRSGPLDPRLPTRLCTFSPCIEQIQRTVQELREYGWLEIEVVELGAKRLEVRREGVSSKDHSISGALIPPASVEEAISRLKEIETKAGLTQNEGTGQLNGQSGAEIDSKVGLKGDLEEPVIHRPEPELKIHTSYLVFAVLPSLSEAA